MRFDRNDKLLLIFMLCIIVVSFIPFIFPAKCGNVKVLVHDVSGPYIEVMVGFVNYELDSSFEFRTNCYEIRKKLRNPKPHKYDYIGRYIGPLVEGDNRTIVFYKYD